MTDSPSALLERAAARLERLAEDAPQAPWRMGGDGDMLGYGPVPIIYSEYGDVEVQWAPGMSDWLIAMSPAVAQPLVEWLRDAARRMELHPHLSPEGSTMQRTALAFARQVLGEPLNHDWFFPYDSHPGARECSRCGAHDDSQPCR